MNESTELVYDLEKGIQSESIPSPLPTFLQIFGVLIMGKKILNFLQLHDSKTMDIMIS